MYSVVLRRKPLSSPSPLSGGTFITAGGDFSTRGNVPVMPLGAPARRAFKALMRASSDSIPKIQLGNKDKHTRVAEIPQTRGRRQTKTLLWTSHPS